MKLLVLDGNSLVNRAFFGIKVLTTKDGRFTNAIYGFMNILEELKRKDEASFRVHMTSYFGSKTSYYRYKLGQTGLVPEQQQYVLKWCQQHGYTNMRFDRYAEEVNY